KKAVETADRIEAAGLDDDDQGHMLGGQKPIVRFVAAAAGRRGFTSVNNSAGVTDEPAQWCSATHDLDYGRGFGAAHPETAHRVVLPALLERRRCVDQCLFAVVM